MSVSTGDGAGQGRAAMYNFPVYLTGNRSPSWWAMVFLIMIEAVTFATLVFAYFYLRATVPAWPPRGYSPPDLVLPTITLALALVSVPAMYVADTGLAVGERGRYLAGAGTAFVLGIALIVLEAIAINQLPFDWRIDAFGSIVWAFVGAWLLAVFIALIQAIIVLIAAAQGSYTQRRRVGVQNLALYWYFIVAVWLVVYLVVYISPRLIGA